MAVEQDVLFLNQKFPLLPTKGRETVESTEDSYTYLRRILCINSSEEGIPIEVQLRYAARSNSDIRPLIVTIASKKLPEKARSLVEDLSIVVDHPDGATYSAKPEAYPLERGTLELVHYYPHDTLPDQEPHLHVSLNPSEQEKLFAEFKLAS